MNVYNVFSPCPPPCSLTPPGLLYLPASVFNLPLRQLVLHESKRARQCCRHRNSRLSMTYYHVFLYHLCCISIADPVVYKHRAIHCSMDNLLEPHHWRQLTFPSPGASPVASLIGGWGLHKPLPWLCWLMHPTYDYVDWLDLMQVLCRHQTSECSFPALSITHCFIAALPISGSLIIWIFILKHYC